MALLKSLVLLSVLGSVSIKANALFRQTVSYESCELVESFELNDENGLFERVEKHMVSYSICDDCRGSSNRGLCQGLYQVSAADFLHATVRLTKVSESTECLALCAGVCGDNANMDVCRDCQSRCETHTANKGSSCHDVQTMIRMYADRVSCIRCQTNDESSAVCAILESTSYSCASGRCSVTADGKRAQRRLENEVTLQFIRTVPPEAIRTPEPTTDGRLEPTVAPVPATTAAPVTPEPTTPAPATAAPTTLAPVTAAPATAAPAAVTAAPVATNPPTTPAPVTIAPVTSRPSTVAPATNAPTTASPMTSAPTTAAPITSVPVTAWPTFELDVSNPATIPTAAPVPVTLPPTTMGAGGNLLTQRPTAFGVGGNEFPQGVTNCGCYGCTNDILNLGTDADGTGVTCRARISYLMQEIGMLEQDACLQVSEEFPNICGQGCDPNTCVRLQEVPTTAPRTDSPATPSLPMVNCGCSSCNQEALAQIAGPEYDGYHSCLDRIVWLMTTKGMDQIASCSQVANEFPDICGAQCDPTACDATNVSEGYGITCGCEECTDEALRSIATDANGSYTCGSRIVWLMQNFGMQELEACERVAAEFPDACAGGCRRDTCTRMDTSTSAPRETEQLVDCGCSTCNAEALDRATTDATGTYTCRERITWLMTEMRMTEVGACRRIGLEFPNECGVPCNPDICSYPIDCGCPSTCTASILDSVAGPYYDGSHSCRARIVWLMESQGRSMNEACLQVATEFPEVCGTGCNPETCVNPDVMEMLQLSAQQKEGAAGQASDSSPAVYQSLLPSCALIAAAAVLFH